MTARKTRTKKPKSDVVVQAEGKVEGKYTTSIWNNGELVSFEINWDKLASIIKNLDKNTAAT
jgi:translation initiation factor 1 (eIF-1/SUI1)